MSARLTASKTAERMEGASWEMDGRLGKPPPTPRAALLHGLVEILTLICLVSSLSGLEEVMGAGGERGRQVRLSMCVFNNGSNKERRRRAGRGTDESRDTAERV